ncbi:hypothetical protein ACFORJ_10630 [Corynebacterium hansenii]|uniref:Uncharacterized protein n=1 Tax=Corynebacterium hansenii TaxID=394964 RepID=A0ABV7ZR45_9CORY|nr:hypothetical protein [Corynebacterium hansenii]WJZ01211.1 hypothetical protein CHAN_13140 [Corynebacterium hansenii]
MRVLEDEGIRFADGRMPVVLILVDGRLPPTRGDVDLVEAVSGATGRCAVGLDVDRAREHGGGNHFAAWRDAVHVDVSVGLLDPAMARTLKLLADGPARPITPTPGQRRRGLLGAQLSADRAGRARAVEKQWRERKAALPHAIADALEEATRGAAPAGARELDAAVAKAGESVAEALGLPGPPAAPEARERPKPGFFTDAGVGLLTLGAAVGAGGVLGGPLQWAGLPSWASATVTGLAGFGLAASLAIGGRRRRIARERAGWMAAHLAKVRRTWDRDIATTLRAETPVPADGWRARHLAAALRAETG